MVGLFVSFVTKQLKLMEDKQVEKAIELLKKMSNNKRVNPADNRKWLEIPLDIRMKVIKAINHE